MKLTLLKRLGAAMAAVMVMGMVPAANVGADEFTYTPLTLDGSDNPYFLKALTMKESATVPNVEFSYEISPISDDITSPDDDAKLPVRKGNTTGTGTAQKPSVGTADFKISENKTKYDLTDHKATTLNIKNTKKQTVEDSVTFSASSVTLGGKKYARCEVPIDFTGVSFSSPGIYRYEITEKASSYTGITDDADKTRILDVYVTDHNKALQLGGFVLHNGEPNTAPDVNTSGTIAEPAKKSEGFINSYSTQDLYFAKVVDGNQASRDKYFKFTVTIDNVNQNDEFKVDITHSVAEPSKTDSTVYSADDMASTTNGNRKTIIKADTKSGNKYKATGDFYLQHDQYIKICGLPKGATYSVTEEKEDYVQTAADQMPGGGGIKTIGTAPDTIIFDDPPVTQTVGETDIYTGYKNTLKGVVPTGIHLTYTPYIIVGIITAAAIILLVVRRRRSER
ncbi:MAG: hypothetical protein J6F31_03715 [Oscillospiraceae bacterium]|nr:hypothetical protein [Oscillospiraceae bacterium]